MAISDQQIFDWFKANPTADDATIASTMDQFKVNPADVARATGTGLAGIQSRYDAVQPFGGLNSLSADNINSTGGYTKSAVQPTSGGVSNVVEGDNVEQQISQLPEEIAHWARSADQRTMELIDDKTGNVLDRRTVGDFSDLDLVKMGLSMVPGAGQILAGVNVADALRTGNLANAAIGATGLAGMNNLNTALRVGQAASTGNTMGALTALAGNSDLQKLVGANEINVGGYTPKDAIGAANLIGAAKNGQYGSAITNAGNLLNSPDTALAGKALSVLQAAESGNINALNYAVSLFNSGSKNNTKTIADAGDVSLPSGIQLAGLRSDTMSDAGNGFNVEISGAPIFAESKNASSVSAPLGYRLMSSSEADARPEGAYYDMTANAWFAPEDLNASIFNQSDVDLFNQSEGDIGKVNVDDVAEEDNLLKYKSPTNVGDLTGGSGEVPELVVKDTKVSDSGKVPELVVKDTKVDDVPELVIQDKKIDDVPELVIQDKKIVDDVPELVIQDKKIVDDVPELVIQDKKIVDDVVTPPVVNPPVVIPPVVKPPVVTPPVATTTKPAAPEKPSAPLTQPKLSYKKTYEETPFLNPLLFSLAGVPVPSQDNKENILTSEIEEEKIKQEEEDKQKEAPALDLLSFFSFAEGGMVPEHPMGQPEFYSEGGAGTTYIQGRGDGTSDQIPAMVANNEYVLPADVVSALGNGSSESGASVLDQFIETIRAHKHSNPPSELPPESKGPLEYLSSVHMKGKR